jgi:hypothetical protein
VVIIITFLGLVKRQMPEKCIGGRIFLERERERAP